MTRFYRAGAALLVASALGCGSSDDGGAAPVVSACGGGGPDAATDTQPPDGGTAGEASSDAQEEPWAPLEPEWYGCPFKPGLFAECASVEVPLNWDDASGKKIQTFLKRSPAKNQPARGQVWVLQGGPGYSDASIEFLGPAFSAMAEDLDIYFPDHRGTGGSERLDCPDLDSAAIGSEPPSLDEVAAAAGSCIDVLKAKYGDGLKHFGAADAGRDVGELIKLTRKPGQQVFVWGVSYGTRWAHRYLQQFPDQATGVIFDSIVDETNDFFKFDEHINAGAKRLLDACSADTFCHGKLGQDAWAKAQAVIAKLDTTGYCATSEKLGKDDYRALLASLAQRDYVSRALVAPILYRLDRCDATDRTVIVNLLNTLRNNTAASAQYFSGALHFNVVSSELTANPPPTKADLDGLDATYTVSSVQMNMYLAVDQLWPAYDPAPWLGTYAATSTPVLMLNGAFDIQTPEEGAAAFASHFTAANQTYVKVDRASHGVLNNSPVEGQDSSCGAIITGAFLKDPTATLDTSCASEAKPLDFEQQGKSFGSGTADLWENVPPPPPPPGKPAPEPSQKLNVLDLLVRGRNVIGGKP
jgi:pimeloyl-ACP methyl ester carboxylesterase